MALLGLTLVASITVFLCFSASSQMSVWSRISAWSKEDLLFFLTFIYFTSFREQNEAYINSPRWSTLMIAGAKQNESQISPDHRHFELNEHQGAHSGKYIFVYLIWLGKSLKHGRRVSLVEINDTWDHEQPAIGLMCIIKRG